MIVHGIPGLSLAVSVDGEVLWREGFGYSNLENGSKCTADTVLRIGSISKSITSTIAGQYVQDGKLNLDTDIRNYVKEFPSKKFHDEEVYITMRQLLSHSSGIRHYKRTGVSETMYLY
ncbi:unnamed protein product [Caenorhabditis sp. 36 PRJEB53466]|nr:unnamed protein product [Caenorhabditis sp. 36 PRJEB53466]